MTIHLRSMPHLAATIAVDGLRPRPPLDLNKWAENNIVFGAESSKKGPWRGDEFPFFREVLKALEPTDPCRNVTMMKSAQVGGTVLAQVFVMGCSIEDPGYLMYVHPTDDNVKRWAKTKFRPMIRNTPVAAACFGASGGDNLTYVERRDGRGGIQIAGASSEASLSMFSASRQVQDDVAKWENNNAGDPEEQADSRSQAFPDAKIFKLSTPLVASECRITKNYLAGTQEKYNIPCPHCEHRHPLEWENFKDSIDPEAPEKAGFFCPECGCLIEQKHRYDMNLKGEWVAKVPRLKNRHRSFHIWSAYSPLMDFQLIAERWLEAQGDPESEKTFFNDVLGLPYEVQGEAPPWEKLKERADAHGVRRGTIPHGHPILTLGIDCQGDRVEWNARAFGPNGRTAHVDYGIIQGHISENRTIERLDDLIKREWPNEAGNKIKPDMTAIDANAYTDDVLAWAKRHPLVIAVRGARSDNAPPLVKVQYEKDRKGKSRKRRGKFFNVGTSPAKLVLYKNLTKEDPLERGYVQIASGFDDDWYKQLTAEVRVPVKQKVKTSTTVFRWEKKHERNEVLDTTIYAGAAAYRVGVYEYTPERWEALIAERDKAPEGAQMDMDDMFTRPKVSAPVQAQPEAEAATQVQPPATVDKPAARPKRRFAS